MSGKDILMEIEETKWKLVNQGVTPKSIRIAPEMFAKIAPYITMNKPVGKLYGMDVYIECEGEE